MLFKFKEFPYKLNEKVLHGIDEDVDYIYQYFKKDIDEIKRTGKVREGMFENYQISTGDLKSKLSKECHLKNPCEIHINHDFKYKNTQLGNFYTPKETKIFPDKNIGVIGLTIHKYAYHLVLTEGYGDLKFSENMFEGISREFQPYKIKATIRHELYHWIDDTVHNKYLTKILKGEYIDKILKKKKIENVNAAPFEIQAMIQNIYQLKKEFKDIWDDLTFDQMIKKLPSLSNIKHSMELYPETYKKWKKQIKSKMWKNDLLGDNMK